MSAAEIDTLAVRRARLIERSAWLRKELAHELDPWDRRVHAAQRVGATLALLKQRPLLVGAATAALAASGPLRMLKWIVRGWGAWRLAMSLRRLLRAAARG